MIFTIQIALLVLTVVASAHTIVFSSAATWWSKQAVLWGTDPGMASARKRAEPWYVRYTSWTFVRFGR